MNELRQLADNWRNQSQTDVLVLGTSQGAKVNLLVAVAKEAVAKGIKAGVIIKTIAPVIGGGGGGRPDMAQAGGKEADKLPQALQAAQEFLEKQD